MKRSFLALALALPACAALAAEPAYPTRPIRIIVAQAAGSGPDIIARIIGQKLTESWGQQVIVDNRPGANGIIGLEAAAKSKADGYTITLAVPSALTMNPYVYKSLPYDTFRDFAPITQTATNTFGLFVNPALPVKSVRELVALARSRPKELPYGSYGVGNQTHLAAELFAGEAKLKLLHVPYKGQTPAVAELLSGQVALIFSAMPGTAPYVGTGRLRLLATCGEKRDAVFGSVPTMVESGYPSVIITGWTGLLGPTGMPREAVTRIQTEVRKHLLSPELKESLTKQGSEPVASTPEQFAAFIKAETNKWSRVIRQAGLEHTQ
ncbi:MAG: Bug family tripartite tricarboxylate transporter substrate binding protein [Betaproteobacteria bacterium]